MSLEVVFCSTEEALLPVYHSACRDVPHTRVARQPASLGARALLLPLSAACGLFSPHCALQDTLLSALGAEVAPAVRRMVERKFLGEMPVGSAVLMRNPGSRIPQCTHLVIAAPFRALTSKGDDMAWLDPQFVTADYAYNVFRAALLAVLRHNARRPAHAIAALHVPDLSALHPVAPDADALAARSGVVRQLVLAARAVLQRRAPASWHDALLATTQILRPAADSEDLETMFTSGELESRGLYNSAELAQVLGWARDAGDAARRERAARVIASCLHRRDTQFHLSKAEIARQVSSQRDGCLPLILEMVMEGKITVHTEIPFDEITIVEKIGDGTAGSVYRGRWGTRPVAIKEFRRDVPASEFLREISLMCVVAHENLVRSHGGVTAGGRMVIVQELMQASLFHVLQEPRIAFDTGVATQLALHAAQGIHYLHAHANLIHRDIKSHNLLINTHEGHLEVKLADFGVSRVINKKQVMTGNVGTVAWTAPEVFEGRRYNEKADVYSFGVILWELCTREIPFAALNAFTIPGLVIKGQRPPLPKAKHKFKKLITACWHPRPKQRPDMERVIEHLTKLHRALPPAEKAQAALDITAVFGVPGERQRASADTPRSESTGWWHDDPEPAWVPTPRRDEPAHFTVTCDIPPPWGRVVMPVELHINGLFSVLRQDLDAGTITVGDSDRYLLFRTSFVADLAAALQLCTPSPVPAAALYALAHALGTADAAAHFAAAPPPDDAELAPGARVGAGLVHLAYLGLGWAALAPTSVLSGDVHIVTHHRHSFEAASLATAPQCQCHFVSGYLAGWNSEALGEALEVAEVACLARGDAQCTLVHAPPARLPALLADTGAAARSHDAAWWRVAVADPPPPPAVPPPPGPPTLSEDDIVERAAEDMDNFFIDPTAATVEIADCKCVMLRAAALSVPVLGGADAAPLRAVLRAWGQALGRSHAAWFADLLSLSPHPVERLLALPTMLAYLGWCNLAFVNPPAAGGEVAVRCTGSFEAAGGDCVLHAGFLAGWVGAALGSAVAVHEVCGRGAVPCEFRIRAEATRSEHSHRRRSTRKQ